MVKEGTLTRCCSTTSSSIYYYLFLYYYDSPIDAFDIKSLAIDAYLSTLSCPFEGLV